MSREDRWSPARRDPRWGWIRRNRSPTCCMSPGWPLPPREPALGRNTIWAAGRRCASLRRWRSSTTRELLSGVWEGVRSWSRNDGAETGPDLLGTNWMMRWTIRLLPLAGSTTPLRPASPSSCEPAARGACCRRCWAAVAARPAGGTRATRRKRAFRRSST
jgi:hypothetical protein